MNVWNPSSWYFLPLTARLQVVSRLAEGSHHWPGQRHHQSLMVYYKSGMINKFQLEGQLWQICSNYLQEVLRKDFEILLEFSREEDYSQSGLSTVRVSACTPYINRPCLKSHYWIQETDSDSQLALKKKKMVPIIRLWPLVTIQLTTLCWADPVHFSCPFTTVKPKHYSWSFKLHHLTSYSAVFHKWKKIFNACMCAHTHHMQV